MNIRLNARTCLVYEKKKVSKRALDALQENLF